MAIILPKEYVDKLQEYTDKLATEYLKSEPLLKPFVNKDVVNE